MRVVLAAVDVGGQELAAVDAIGDGARRASASWFFSNSVGHLPFEVQAVEEDEVGVVELLAVAGAGDVLVRIDARPHQRLDLHAVAADALDHVGDDGGGADDANGRTLELGRAVAAGTADEGERKCADYQQQQQSNESAW